MSNQTRSQGFTVPPEAGAVFLFVPLTLVLALLRPWFHDEVATFTFAGSDVATLAGKLRQDVHPPLYFAVAWVILRVGSLAMMRLFSIACFAAAIWILLHHFPLAGVEKRARWRAALLVATSPFLVFVACFARYYGLVFLEVALLLVIMRRILVDGSRRGFFAGGLLAGLLLLTNYAAGLLAGRVAVTALVYTSFRRRDAGSACLSLLPFLLCLLGCLPLLLSQVSSGMAERTAFSPRGFVVNAAKAGVYLPYCFGASDGLPPWSLAGPPVAMLALVAPLAGAVRALRSGRAGRLWLGAWLACLAGALVLAGLTFAGETFIFFPPRVAWLVIGFLALTLMAVRGGGAGSRLLFALALGVNMAGLAGMILSGRTTVWAYQVPARDIAVAVQEELARGDASLHLDGRGLGSIYFALRDKLPEDMLTPSGGSPRRVITVGATRTAPWPPSESVGTPPERDPAGSYRQVDERFFLEEDEATRRIKRRIVGREVEQYKIVLRVFEKDELPREESPRPSDDGGDS